VKLVVKPKQSLDDNGMTWFATDEMRRAAPRIQVKPHDRKVSSPITIMCFVLVQPVWSVTPQEHTFASGSCLSPHPVINKLVLSLTGNIVLKVVEEW